MPTKPTPGGNTGTWGAELNDYLDVSLDAAGRIKPSAIGHYDVRDYGAVGDGTGDDGPAFAAAFAAAIAVNGKVLIPQPSAYYRITSTIPIYGLAATLSQIRVEVLGRWTSIIWEGADNDVVFDVKGIRNSVFNGLGVLVQADNIVVWDIDTDAVLGSTSFNAWKNCDTTFQSGFTGGIAWRLGHLGPLDISFCHWDTCRVAGSLIAGAHKGWSVEALNALVCLWTNCGGSALAKFWTNVSSAGATSPSGGAAHTFVGCGGSSNDVDYEFATAGAYTVLGGRWELGKRAVQGLAGGHVSGPSVVIRGVTWGAYTPTASKLIDLTWAVSLDMSNCYYYGSDATASLVNLQTTAGWGSFTARDNKIQMASPGRFWTLVAGTWLVDVKSSSIASSQATTGHVTSDSQVLTYGATVNTVAYDRENVCKITVTNGTAFTIANPTNPSPGQRLTYDILNSSGGAMGAVTWGAAFKLAGAFVNPATTTRRTISFIYDGTNWVEQSRAAADI